MKAANRRELDFKLVISALDAFMTHGEWDKAALNVVSLWKMAEEHGGEWKEVKSLVIAYVKDWVKTTEVKPIVYDKFFVVLTANGINVPKTFGVKKDPSLRKPQKKKPLPEDIIELPKGDFTMPPQFDPYTQDYQPTDQNPQIDPTLPQD